MKSIKLNYDMVKTALDGIRDDNDVIQCKALRDTFQPYIFLNLITLLNIVRCYKLQFYLAFSINGTLFAEFPDFNKPMKHPELQALKVEWSNSNAYHFNNIELD